MLKPILAAAMLLTSTAGQVAAVQWDVSNDKGLVVHRLADDALRLTVVCDPDGAFSPPQEYAIFEQSGQRVEGGEVVISRGDTAATLVVVGGSAIPFDNEQAWSAAVSMLLAGGPVNISLGNETVHLDLAPSNSRCQAR